VIIPKVAPKDAESATRNGLRMLPKVKTKIKLGTGKKITNPDSTSETKNIPKYPQL